MVIAYTLEPTSGTAKYGACVHACCREHPESWNKRAHRTTALERLLKFPVTVDVSRWLSDAVEPDMYAVEGAIRRAMFTHGCSWRHPPSGDGAGWDAMNDITAASSSSDDVE